MAAVKSHDWMTTWVVIFGTYIRDSESDVEMHSSSFRPFDHDSAPFEFRSHSSKSAYNKVCAIWSYKKG